MSHFFHPINTKKSHSLSMPHLIESTEGGCRFCHLATNAVIVVFLEIKGSLYFEEMSVKYSEMNNHGCPILQ